MEDYLKNISAKCLCHVVKATRRTDTINSIGAFNLGEVQEEYCLALVKPLQKLLCNDAYDDQR